MSLSDYDENTRPVYHASIEKNRLVNQKGSEESVVSVEQREKLGGWNGKNLSRNLLFEPSDFLNSGP